MSDFDLELAIARSLQDQKEFETKKSQVIYFFIVNNFVRLATFETFFNTHAQNVTKQLSLSNRKRSVLRVVVKYVFSTQIRF